MKLDHWGSNYDDKYYKHQKISKFDRDTFENNL
jgi:hypothetical protein